jgi:hypothetical protein
MSQIDKKRIEQSLVKKGFVPDDTHHRYFHHEYNGKRTGISTYTSHGDSIKTYGDQLLGMMKRQLRLDTLQELKALLNCPMDSNEYNNKLKGKGLLP